MTNNLPINIHVTIGLPVYGNGVHIQQPKRVNSYPRLNGGLLRGLPNGKSPRRGSHDQNPLGRPPPNPLVGFYGWQAPNPRIFMPPWYQSVPTLSKPTNKLPY
jgi:hypothetical protein